MLERLRKRPKLTVYSVAAFVTVAATCLASRPVLRQILHAYHPDPGHGSYPEALLAVNYFDDGIARRGLHGTISKIIGLTTNFDPHSFFHIFSGLFLSLPLGLLLGSLARKAVWRAAWLTLVLVLSPQTFQGWASDIAHGDMLNAGFVAWAALLAASRKYSWSTVPLALGLLGHETVIVYGVPLLAALILSDGDETPNRRHILFIVGLLAAEIALVYLVQLRFGAPNAQIVRAIMESGSTHPEVDYAAYFATSGVRGILASQCIMFSTHIPAVAIPSSVVVVAAYCVILLPTDRKFAIAVAAAGLLPLILMMILAIDYGRWVMLAVANAGLAATVLHLRRPDPLRLRVIFCAAALFLALLLMKPAVPWFPSSTMLRVEERIFGHETTDPYILPCDSGWRRLIGQR